MTTVWTPNTAYSLNNIMRPPTPNGYRYKCTTAGTSTAHITRKYENYFTGYSLDIMAQGTSGQVFQAFTPSISHTLNSVTLLLMRYLYPGTFKIGIRSTSGGKPTGTDLCSATSNGNTLPDSSLGTHEARAISLGTGTPVTAGTQYAIVLYLPSVADPSAQVRWAWSTSDVYSGGYNGNTYDGGSTWNLGEHVAMFQEWEIGVSEPTWPTTPGATVSDGTVVWTNDGKRTIPHRSFIIG